MFDCDLAVRAKTDTVWELTAPLTWTGKLGDTFTVPAGYLTDFATVPRFLHWLISPYGGYTRAAVLHDFLITDRINHPDPALRVTSRDTDNIFRVVMADLGVPWVRRWTMWAAVRAASLGNPRRANGRAFHRDAPKVLAIAVAVVPVILPGVIGVLISLGFVRVITAFRKPEHPTTTAGTSGCDT